MIAPQILILSTILSAIWLPILVAAVKDYRRIPPMLTIGRRRERILALRWVVGSLCVFSICFAYVLRVALVLVGLGNDVIGQVTFFALLTPILIGGLFCLVSLRYDD